MKRYSVMPIYAYLTIVLCSCNNKQEKRETYVPVPSSNPRIIYLTPPSNNSCPYGPYIDPNVGIKNPLPEFIDRVKAAVPKAWYEAKEEVKNGAHEVKEKYNTWKERRKEKQQVRNQAEETEDPENN